MRVFQIGLVAAALFAFGCGDDTGNDEAGVIERPHCEEIGHICHDYDCEDGSNPKATECHDVGHDHTSTDATCEAMVAECHAACSDESLLCDDHGHGHH